MEYFDELSSLFESDDADLFRPKHKGSVATPDDQLIDSFSKITLFVRHFGRLPKADADDLDEAVLGTQLNSIKADTKKSKALETYDELGLLELEKAPETLDELFAADYALFDDDKGLFDVAKLPDSKRIVEHTEEVAKREPIKDFENSFKQIFIEQQNLLSEGTRKLTPFHSIDQIQAGNFYVYDGMMCFVPEFGEKERKAGGYTQQRISVVFENGTQSNMFKRSLAQRLYEGGLVVVNADYVPPLGSDDAVGRIYVLKSLSEDPKVKMIKDLYKIGVTSSDVVKRVQGAANDPTYLMAPVQILEDYRLTGSYNPQKVEALIHKVFGDAKVDLEIINNKGISYTPSEWYSVPLPAINEAIDLLATGEIVDYHYDKELQRLVPN